ncbi:hypothetical protein A0J57_22160 [Sphingobium sp. 22B]|uniref:hypothetical protein n=1 Tax=unclassified Sphingobium TaxID=2611147 RepID=UPI000785B42E|nr:MULTISPECIES: hypothetical protein [unclassified Sphingobium]KXU31845.1 hypothetical protein AXW74_10330 [Sphingobium sp. AM]KYC30074.1 hypothetical protein A0J57_22160 [Sphingobium sp. 22B]OAP29690.1 hypothetical protein A8O16_22155 [Sphingobium sp. 20006FA]PNQ01647.1 hypothetical protein A8G00_16540 [Sphingobium sp. SA916]
MNDYISRTELSVERGATRAPSAVSAIAPISSAATVHQGGGSSRQAPTPEDQSGVEESIATSAEYAKVHARIADILAELRSQGGTVTVDGAADEIQSMLPEPQILVPLPPASKEAVESTIRVAKRIAEQAAYAHAAQANIRRGAVDQILSPGA